MLDSLNQSRLSQLHPKVNALGASLIAEAAKRGIPVLITQGLRTWEEQDALYAKGRTVAPIGKQYIVTKAKGGQSYHNFGLAFDLAPLDSVGKADWDTSHPSWKVLAEIGKSLGLEWGGDWVGFKDLPHFQYTAGISLATCRTLYTKGQLNAVWAAVK